MNNVSTAASRDLTFMRDEPFSIEDWLAEFSSVYGRPPKVLHIGNIANNAYNIAKLQRRYGIHADVMCPDYYHIMGCPEWEDAEFENIPNHFHPNWSRVHEAGYERPSWFVQDQFKGCVFQLLQQFESHADLDELHAAVHNKWQGMKTAIVAMMFQAAHRSRFRGVFRAMWRPLRYSIRRLRHRVRNPFDQNHPWTRWCNELGARWSELQPNRDVFDFATVMTFGERCGWLTRLFRHYDIVQAYGTDPWWPMLCNHHPFVAYEHGTLRECPYQQGFFGQLTYLAYHLADHIFVTNGDCQSRAEAIGSGTYSATLHGVDDHKYQRPLRLREDLQKQHNARYLYFCPVRHDWDVKGTHKHIYAARLLRDKAGNDFRFFMAEWGNDLDRSRKLVRSLGLEDVVQWIQPLPRTTLIRWLASMDCVLDQIRLPHFGCTAPESMACGVPVIMSYRPESTDWIIDEPAPILSAWTPEDIQHHLLALRDDHFRQKVGRRGREWFERNHSSERIVRDHALVYRRLLQNRSRKADNLSAAPTGS